ncbi:MAG: hypothetical protein ACRC2U_07210 [Aeromonas sp.]
MNNKQSVSREEYRRLDIRVICIPQQRWPCRPSPQICRRHIVEGLTPCPSTRTAPSGAQSPAAPSGLPRDAVPTEVTRAQPSGLTQGISQHYTRWWLTTEKSVRDRKTR